MNVYDFVYDLAKQLRELNPEKKIQLINISRPIICTPADPSSLQIPDGYAYANNKITFLGTNLETDVIQPIAV